MQNILTASNVVVVFIVKSIATADELSAAVDFLKSSSTKSKTFSFELFRSLTGPDVLGGGHRRAPAAGRL